MKSSRCLTGATLFASKVLSSSATNFLPHATLLADVEDPAWFERNVPILDVPDQQIQDVYYYRWQTWREHLFYTGPQYGFLETEFLLAVGYGGPFGGIVAAAGHHINEGRWLRDKSIGQDLINFVSTPLTIAWVCTNRSCCSGLLDPGSFIKMPPTT